MKPRLMGQKYVRYGGSDEALVDYTCCDDAKEKIERYHRTHQIVGDLLDHMRPEISAGFIVSYRPAKLELNFCPVCGTSYKKEDS